MWFVNSFTQYVGSKIKGDWKSNTDINSRMAQVKCVF